MADSIEKTQATLLKHHGGNGFKAQMAILNSYESRHGDEFWAFWDEKMACCYQNGDAVMDMGAGAGQFVRDCAVRYPSSLITGIDAATYMVNDPVKLPSNTQFILDDLNNPQTKFQENSFAMIMANTVIHELSQPVKMLKSVLKWLKPNGRFCLIEGVKQPLSEQLMNRYTTRQIWGDNTSSSELEDVFQYYFEHNQYQEEDLLFLLKNSGFNIIESELIYNGRLARIVVEKPA